MTKKLVVLAGPDEGRVFPLGGEVLLLGRSRATESHLIDPHVSRVHCQVHPDGGHFTLVDFDSAGGTFVNGKPITRHTLQPGDLIRIGNTRLQFLEDFETAQVAAAPTVQAPAARKATSWAQELVGQSLTHYTVGSPMARGKTGYVFHGRDTKRDLPVAVKVMRPEFAEDEQKVQHFVEAMKTVMPLQHPNLLRFYGAGRTGGHLWVASEYVAGDSLAAVIGRTETVGKLDWKLVLRAGVYLARALAYAHGKGLIHQNVDPQNILVGKHPQDTKLADLMLATALEEDPTRPIAAAGTPSDALPYQSPERTDGNKAQVDARTDLYSLGATLYAMAAGKPPFQGDTVAELVDQIRLDSPPRLHRVRPDVPEALDRTVRRLMAKRPHDRHASADELVRELEGLAHAHALPL